MEIPRSVVLNLPPLCLCLSSLSVFIFVHTCVWMVHIVNTELNASIVEVE